MSKKVNPTSIGVFVVAALSIFAIFVAVLFNGQWFKQTSRFVLFFDSSINGLNVGAPVKFRGVQIGTVKSVAITYDNDTGVVYTPLIIDIDSELFVSNKKIETKSNRDSFFDKQIMSGLAAKLSMESLITGKLFIELDYYRPNKVRFYGKNDTSYQQIPTVTSSIEKLVSGTESILMKIGEIDFKTLSAHATSILSNLDRQIQKMDLKELIHNLSGASASFRTFFQSDQLKSAISGVSSVMQRFDKFIEQLQELVNHWGGDYGDAIKRFKEAAKQFKETCVHASDLIAPDSDFRQGAKEFIFQGIQTLHLLKELLALLNKSPNVILTGIDYEK